MLFRNQRANVGNSIGTRAAIAGTISYWLPRLLTGCCALLFPIPSRAQEKAVLIVVAHGDRGDPRALAIGRGLTLGAEEGLRTARLFGVAMRFLDAEGMALDSSAARDVAVWVVAGDETRCGRLRAALRGIAATVIDAGCREVAAATVNERHIHPPAHDSISALATARGDSTARVLLWHPSLDRFGADQLNERFRRRFSADMDSDAWAAWAAVKIAVESCLRARARGVAPAAVLEDDAMAFDAHKGAPLRFDRETRRLVQPLYLETTSGGAAAIREVSPPARDP